MPAHSQTPLSGCGPVSIAAGASASPNAATPARTTARTEAAGREKSPATAVLPTMAAPLQPHTHESVIVRCYKTINSSLTASYASDNASLAAPPQTISQGTNRDGSSTGAAAVRHAYSTARSDRAEAVSVGGGARRGRCEDAAADHAGDPARADPLRQASLIAAKMGLCPRCLGSGRHAHFVWARCSECLGTGDRLP
jgi:hypothetical protein